MQNKYYTPEIEEFHFGFEYQEDDNNSNNWKTQNVGKDNIGDLDYFDDLIREGNIRVKYLDQQDIEECGWIFKEIEIGMLSNRPLFKFKNYSLSFDRNEHGIWLLIIDEYSDYQHFSGKVKNKSELKKLMQMLNIKTDAK